MLFIFFEDEKIYCLIVMVPSCCAAISIFPGTAKKRFYNDSTALHIFIYKKFTHTAIGL